MRILRTTLMGLLALGLLGVHGSASAALITGVSIEDVSSEFNTDRDAGNTIDGSGLTGGGGVFGAGVHGINPTGEMWLTGGSAIPATITYDLGANYDLSEIHVWNYNEAGGNLPLGANAVTISVSPTGLTGDLVELGDFTFAIATGLTDYTGFDVGIGTSALLDDVRLVRFEITSIHTGSTLTGLSEVQFDGVAVIPEPTSLLLVGLGMLGLVGFGRRRK